jgi:LacI family transcriptional regulator
MRKESKPSAESDGVVSLASVAQLASVSITTVSRVVNGVPNKASEATIERVRAAIEELGYRPGGIGRALRRQQSRVVGVLVANIANPSMAALASAAEQVLRDSGHVMALCDTHECPVVQDEYLLEMRSQLACAVVLAGAVPSPGLDALRAAGHTVVYLNRPDPGDPASSYVGIDNRRAGADIAAHLLAHGERRAAVLHATLNHTAALWRVEGFLDTMHEGGARQADLPCATFEGLDHQIVGYHAMDQLLAADDCPRVVVCMSDLLAYGAYRRIREAGLSVPREFVLFGFDDNPINPWLADWLNSVRMPLDQFGPALMTALQAQWTSQQRKQIILPHELVIRSPL